MSSEDLISAAQIGDVKFLRNCVASGKPREYYLTLPGEEKNFLHAAVRSNKVEFIREAISVLPLDTIQLLLIEQDALYRENPLHFAASTGIHEIVKLFLEVYQEIASLLSEHEKPWLASNADGDTPCHVALYMGHEACALDIWKMDMELLSNSLTNNGWTLLSLAVYKGHNNFALEMLRSPFSFSSTNADGFTDLHYVAHCSSDEEICRQLLKRDPKLIKQNSQNGISVLHYWAQQNKLWPYECLLKSTDIIPDVRKILVDSLLATDKKNGFNPLHILAIHDTSNEEGVVEIAKLLIENYKQEVGSSQMSLPNISEHMLPWLMEDKQGCTPLFHAIYHKKQQYAAYILSEDNNTLKKTPSALLFAIQKGCHEVAEMILDIVDDKGWTELLTNCQQVNALHLAPLCKRDFCERLLGHHSHLLEKVDKDGATMFHAWVKMGEVWPFEYLLRSEKLESKKRSQFVKLIPVCDYSYNNPLHYAARSTHQAAYQIAKLLVAAFKEENPSWSRYSFNMLPWFDQYMSIDGPLHLAMCNKREKLALYFLSLLDKPISELLDFYKPCYRTLFLALESNCYQVAKEILTKLDKESWSKYVMNSYDGRTILHLAPYCQDKEFGCWLVQQASEFITQKDNRGNTALDEASEFGATWIVKAMLEKDPLAFEKAPLAWVKACKNGHTSVVRVFIDYYPGRFSDHCIKYLDSPLHNIQLRNLMGYEEFLQIPHMKDLINVQDSQGATPLHKAIQNDNIFLTEALLNLDKIRYNIKDHKNSTAKDLLVQKCKEQPSWDHMCRSIGFDPRISTTYFEHKTNMLDVRNTLSVVAALLATITFTAGFTLPGGFNHKGEAVLATKAVFIVFLISDTLAMCCSMLVLICLIWSMVYDSNKSLFLIDRSMMLLMLALYCTLVAFMTGVYIVISPNSLWPAILIIVLCSLIGISANRSLLYKVLDNFIPSANKDVGDRIRSLELGKTCFCGGVGCLKCN